MKKDKSPILLFDYDFLFYMAACVVEKKSIVAVNKITGDEMVFKNRTEFWGRGKTIGGELANINKSRTSPFTKEDFYIEERKELEPIENCFHVFNMSVKSICSQLDTKKYYGFTGTGETFRERLSTLQKYKGNRETMEKPAYLDALKEYAMQYHECYLVKDIEADDAVSIDAYGAHLEYSKTGNESDKVITVSVDKDAKACTGFLFNPNKYFEPIEVNGIGSIYLDDKGKPDGDGRAWLYYQILYGDPTDNYDPAVFSSKKNGEIGCFNRIKDCKTDKEYWQAIVNHYRELYPEPFEFESFRGDKIEANWLYVLQEITDMAHMQRWPDDRLNVQAILHKMRVDYDL